MTFLGILIGLGVLAFLLDAGLNKMYQNPRTPHQATPEQFGIAFEEVRFPTRNQRTLYGWWIPAKDETSGSKQTPTLVLVHGWGRNVERMLPYIERLHPLGYHLLAFDARHHGSSDPDGHASMPKFAEDIRAALDFLEDKLQEQKGAFGVVGLSVGGSAAIYAASQDARIRSVVTVGAFAHPGEVIRTDFRKRGIPAFPLAWLICKHIELRIGHRLDRIAPVHNIAKSEAHMLLIHGEEDAVIPVEQAKKLHRAADPERVRLWLLPGKGHSDCHLHPEFWRRVGQFLKIALVSA